MAEDKTNVIAPRKEERKVLKPTIKRVSEESKPNDFNFKQLAVDSTEAAQDSSEIPTQLDVKMEQFPHKPELSTIIMNQSNFNN